LQFGEIRNKPGILVKVARTVVKENLTKSIKSPQTVLILDNQGILNQGVLECREHKDKEDKDEASQTIIRAAGLSQVE
jgi:hypothetical protein